MDRLQAVSIIKDTLQNKFDKNNFRNFIVNLLDGIDETKSSFVGNAQVRECFRKKILSYHRIGKYTDKDDNVIDALIVHLADDVSLEKARTLQRNFIADYMITREKENALVAFYKDNSEDWRFSFVKFDTNLKQDEKGNFKVEKEFTPAKRYSFLVGALEPNHTAQSRLVELLAKDYPVLADIEEAFNVEKISKEFFANYKELYEKLVENLKDIRNNEPTKRIDAEFILNSIKEEDFCKKLLGQLVFLYFIQKKGWLGVKRDKNWGDGDKQFLRHAFEQAVKEGKNFFNDILEPLFYTALNNGERDNDWFNELQCKIPFLNGGLFECYNNYDWINTDIVFSNDIFSNKEKNKTGDIGTGILDVFDRYNFTVKEDEPLEKEVAIDPEMLGKVFENLLPENIRKGNGAFYTPREIVHYMCQESLINYLCTELNVVEDCSALDRPEQIALIEPETKQLGIQNQLSKKDIEDFIHHSDKITEKEYTACEKDGQSKIYNHIMPVSIKNNAKKIDEALENIKICDPAIGSGAFPVGMLNEIVRARIALVNSGYLTETKKRSIYEYKRQAIQNSIYGVDIDSGAVEIAKLRLWLSLVVEEDNIEDIQALPNLDYKIVQGNSLLSVERNVFTDYYFRQLEELKPQFFNETRKREKKKLKQEIDNIIKELTKDGTFDFEIYFSEVFHQKGGFDVVIGNPPYIGQKGHKDLFDSMKKDPYFEKKMDYWYFFLHKAYDILQKAGIVSYITPNYWITAQGGKKLRKRFVNDFNIIEVINFNQNNIFEAGVHTNIFLLQKGNSENNNIKYCIFQNTYESDFIKNKDRELNFNVKQSNIFSNWSGFVNFLPDNILTVVNKLIINSEKLCDEATVGTSKQGITAGKKVTDGICNINQGIVTGKDRYIDKINGTNSGVFVLNKQELQDLNLSDFENAHIKDFYKNSDIKPYYINQNNKNYLIHINNIDKEEELSKLPHIYEHMKKYKNILQERSINGVLESAYKKGKWWALTTDRPNINFDGMNIVCPQRSSRNTFAISFNNFYSASDIFYISQNKTTVDLKYVLAIINSKLIYFWLYWLGKKKGNILELTLEPLQYIPIKNIDSQKQGKFISIVNLIHNITQSSDYIDNEEKQQTVKNYEKQIDIMVYKLYELTYDEVKVIDPNFTLTEAEYNNYQL